MAGEADRERCVQSLPELLRGQIGQNSSQRLVGEL